MEESKGGPYPRDVWLGSARVPMEQAGGFRASERVCCERGASGHIGTELLLRVTEEEEVEWVPPEEGRTWKNSDPPEGRGRAAEQTRTQAHSRGKRQEDTGSRWPAEAEEGDSGGGSSRSKAAEKGKDGDGAEMEAASRPSEQEGEKAAQRKRETGQGISRTTCGFQGGSRYRNAPYSPTGALPALHASRAGPVMPITFKITPFFMIIFTSHTQYM